MHRLTRISLLAFVLTLSMLGLTSCEVINPKEDIPAFVNIKNPQVLLDSAKGFYSTLGIKDVWVYQDEDLVGIFPFPSTFPYLDLEKTRFYFEGGVYETGLSSFKIPFPFWRPLTYTIDQSPLDTIVIEPIFTYIDEEQYNVAFEEDFEDLNLAFNPIVLEDTANFYRTDRTSFQGNFCGTARFTNSSRYMELVSDELPYIPRNVDTWAEVTYKTDIPFTVGLYWLEGAPGTIGEVVFSPTKGEWNTVYVHMVNLIRNSPDNLTVQKGLWIKALSDSLNGDIYLDNIRVIHF